MGSGLAPVLLMFSFDLSLEWASAVSDRSVRETRIQRDRDLFVTGIEAFCFLRSSLSIPKSPFFVIPDFAFCSFDSKGSVPMGLGRNSTTFSGFVTVGAHACSKPCVSIRKRDFTDLVPRSDRG
jgi:hypothetical protein